MQDGVSSQNLIQSYTFVSSVSKGLEYDFFSAFQFIKYLLSMNGLEDIASKESKVSHAVVLANQLLGVAPHV